MQIGAQLEIYEVDTLSMVDSVVEALKGGYSTYSVLESHGVAVWMRPSEIRERLNKAGFVINVVNQRKTMLQPQQDERDPKRYMISFSIAQKPRYSSVQFKIYAKSHEVSNEIKKELTELFEDKKIKGQLFGVRWFFSGGAGMNEACTDEIFEDILHDEAYPEIIKEYGSLTAFVENYIKSDESILILQGPPGTGKTRLIRLILATLSNLKEKQADEDHELHDVMYTGDSKLFESDGLFVRFIIGEERALVVEDADHVLKPRADGNQDIHRFLATSDGLISSTGRKIIFSTNLPNIGDVDEALARPGRCFARMTVRNLTKIEAVKLFAKLKGYEGEEGLQLAAAALVCKVDKSGKSETYSLAEIYKATKNTA